MDTTPFLERVHGPDCESTRMERVNGSLCVLAGTVSLQWALEFGPLPGIAEISLHMHGPLLQMCAWWNAQAFAIAIVWLKG